MTQKQEHRIHHALVFILVALSGFPFFYMDPLVRPLLFASCLFALILFFNRRNAEPDRFLTIYLVIFIGASAGQVLTFDELPITTILGYVVRILLAYLVVKITGRNFIRIYIQQLFFFTVISFFFYFGTLVLPELEHFFVANVAPVFELPQSADAFYKITPNIIVFNFNSLLNDPSVSIIRNSGPFWEPGAFAGFLVIGLIFNLIRTKKLADKYNIVFIIGILTTTSTAGYIALFLIVVLYYVQLSSNLVKLLVAPALIGVALFSYYQLEFLGTKINRNQQSIRTSNSSNRFVSALRDIEDVKKYWLFGRGMNETTRYSNASYLQGIDKHRNNGVTAIFVNVGLVLGIAYFALIRRSFAAMCTEYGVSRFFSWSVLLVILIIGFSEVYFTKVFFIALTMLSVIYRKRTPVQQNTRHDKDLYRYSDV